MLRDGAELAKARAAVVLLHGRGADARDILAFSRHLATDGVAFLAPEATGHAWYPQRFLAPIPANEPWLSSALSRLEAVEREIAAAGVADDRIVWFGFSQGACLATEFVARHARRWGGLVAATGGRIGPPGTDFAAPGDLAGTPVYLGSGDPDPHVPWSRVEESAAAFTAQGAAVTIRRYPGFPHSVHPEAVDFARRLLAGIAAT